MSRPTGDIDALQSWLKEYIGDSPNDLSLMEDLGIFDGTSLTETVMKIIRRLDDNEKIHRSTIRRLMLKLEPGEDFSSHESWQYARDKT